MHTVIAYKTNNSFVHNLDTRTCLLWILSHTFAVYFIKKWEMIIILFLLSIMIGILAKIDFQKFRLFIIVSILGIFFIGFILSLFVNATLQDAVFRSLKFTGRIVTLLLVGLIFMTTNSPIQIALALKKLKSPSPLALTFAFTLNFIPLVAKIIRQVVWAQKARVGKKLLSFRSIVLPWEYIFPIVIPIFRIGTVYIDDINFSLASRGFSISSFVAPKRIALRTHDFIIILLCLILIGGTIAINNFL